MKDIDTIRQGILKGLLRMIAVAGLIAMGPSLWACVAAGLWALLVFDCLIYAWILAIAFLPGVSYRVQLYSIIAIGLGLGTAVMVFTGANGAGYIWMTFAVLVAALLGKKGVTLATYGATILLTLLYAGASGLHLIPNAQAPAAVLVIASNLAIVFAALIFVVRFLIQGLEASIAESREVASTLGLELGKNGDLLKELNHRVRNNLQLSLSLVGMAAAKANEGDGPRLAVVERRLRAMAIANELILDSPNLGRVELRDLVRLVAYAEAGKPGEGQDRRQFWTLGDFTYALDSGDAVALGIGIAEIVHALGGLAGGRIDLVAKEDGARLVFRTCPPQEALEEAVLEGLRDIVPAGSLDLAPPEAGHGPGLSLALGAQAS